MAILHHTYGYDPEIVAGSVDITSETKAAYEVAMEQESARSKAAQVKTIIKAANV